MRIADPCPPGDVWVAELGTGRGVRNVDLWPFSGSWSVGAAVLWRFLGLPAPNVFLVIPFELAVVVALPVAFGLALLVVVRPKV